MKASTKVLAVLLCLAPTVSSAQVRELSQAELRRAVAERVAYETQSLIRGVERFTGGIVIEVRAFGVDGSVIYRVLVRHDNGRLVPIMVNGATGYEVSSSTPAGREVMTVAASTNSTGAVRVSSGSNSGNSNSGNSNSGNSGGYGNSNSGGNGNSSSNGRNK